MCKQPFFPAAGSVHKKDLQKGIEQANKILNSKDKSDIINKFKNNNN